MTNALLHSSWLPAVSLGGLKRVVVHWTAGTYAPSSLDRAHYHFLVDGEGAVHRGLYSVLDNVSAADGRYAAHTRGCNTGSIGIAACCMAGAVQSPFSTGPYPLLELQWDRLAQIAAELCGYYGIPVDEEHVLGHGEVQSVLGIAQKGKWDPLARPWVARPLEGAMTDFRSRARLELRRSPKS